MTPSTQVGPCPAFRRSLFAVGLPPRKLRTCGEKPFTFQSDVNVSSLHINMSDIKSATGSQGHTPASVMTRFPCQSTLLCNEPRRKSSGFQHGRLLCKVVHVSHPLWRHSQRIVQLRQFPSPAPWVLRRRLILMWVKMVVCECPQRLALMARKCTMWLPKSVDCHPPAADLR